MPRVLPTGEPAVEGASATRGWLAGRLSKRKSSLSSLDGARVTHLNTLRDEAVQLVRDQWCRLLSDTLPHADATLRLCEIDVPYAHSATAEKQVVFARVQTRVCEFSIALCERQLRRSAATCDWDSMAALLAQMRPAETLALVSDSRFRELHSQVVAFVRELRALLFRLCVLHVSVSTPPEERRATHFRLS